MRCPRVELVTTPFDQMCTDGLHRVQRVAHVSRAHFAPNLTPPKPPNCIISTPEIDVHQTEMTKILCATVHKNRWPDGTPPTTVLVAERKTEFGPTKKALEHVARGAIWSEKTRFLTPVRTGTRGPWFCPFSGI